MELLGAVYEEERRSVIGTSSDEADFVSNILNDTTDPYGLSGSSNLLISSSFWCDQAPIMAVSAGADDLETDENSKSTYYLAQGNDILLPCASHETYYPITMDYGVLMEGRNESSRLRSSTNDHVNEVDYGFQYHLSSKENILDEFSNPRESSNKRLRMPIEVQKNERNIKMKTLNLEDDDDNNNINNNTLLLRRSTSSCTLEDDLGNGSHELNGGLASSSSDSKGCGRARASRGSATDPQSLYARKRRERINERLRILQALVPNGTKVDISTMLEEAVEYVKFLQLQIKLLSSDELWMFAPIAYNGMGLRLDHLRITAPKSQES